MMGKSKNNLPSNKENFYSFLLSVFFCLSGMAQNEMNGVSLATDFRCMVQ